MKIRGKRQSEKMLKNFLFGPEGIYKFGRMVVEKIGTNQEKSSTLYWDRKKRCLKGISGISKISSIRESNLQKYNISSVKKRASTPPTKELSYTELVPW